MTAKTKKAGWLSQEIDTAHNSILHWPEWMHKAARFEGNNHVDLNQTLIRADKYFKAHKHKIAK